MGNGFLTRRFERNTEYVELALRIVLDLSDLNVLYFSLSRKMQLICKSEVKEIIHEKSDLDFRNYFLDINIHWRCICHYKSRTSECRICSNSRALVYDLF